MVGIMAQLNLSLLELAITLPYMHVAVSFCAFIMGINTFLNFSLTLIIQTAPALAT